MSDAISALEILNESCGPRFQLDQRVGTASVQCSSRLRARGIGEVHEWNYSLSEPQYQRSKT